MTSDALRDTFGFTPTELRVADTLIQNEGKVISRVDLLVTVWGVPVDLAPKMATRSVDMTVTRVRRKIVSFGIIKSVRGFGYRFVRGEK